MAVSNLTQTIGANECIGDSLTTINSNFSALDAGLRNVSKPVADLGTYVLENTTEQQTNESRISTTNNVVFDNKFESTYVAAQQSVALSDGTTINTVSFPYTNSAPYPLATFSLASLTEKAPQVTLYYLASGVDSTTVYALNSAVSTSDKGPIWFDDTVSALAKNGNTLYAGGSFQTVGGTTSRKFCQINLAGGLTAPSLSAVGSYVSNPFGSGTGLGPDGSVDVIQLSGSFLIVGGSFSGGDKGRGLCVLSGSQVSPFYVNGSVKAIEFSGTDLFVGGNFDFIKYNSGDKIYSKGLVKIDLNSLTSLNVNISDASQPFNECESINALAFNDSKLFVGGKFKVRNGSNQITHQNLCLLDSSGSVSNSFEPVIEGSVNTLLVDVITGGSTYLYVGGSFNKCYTNTNFNSNPRTQSTAVDFYNVVSYEITSTTVNLQPNWKPKFNGSVNKFVLHDATTEGEIYCYGNFTAVNDKNYNYLVALKKTSSISSTEKVIETWNPFLERGPGGHTNALIKHSNALIVGGNFESVNNNLRYKLASLSDVDGGLNTTPLSSVVWDLGYKITGAGTNYSTNSTEFVSVTCYPTSYGNVNTVTFPADESKFKGNVTGQPIRFVVRRPGRDKLQQTVNVLSWKADFNR